MNILPAGRRDVSQATGNTVNTSFHSGDVPSHQEAIRAAIAAGADGIVSGGPNPGSLIEVVAEARAAGIPIVNINTPDPDADWNAYVGGDLVAYGTAWAQYMVDNGLVKEGDFVWMPVEVPGATYGVQEEEGIASVFEPLGITWEVTDATLDQAEIITRMSDYLTANRDKIDAIIGLGDLVTGSIARVLIRSAWPRARSRSWAGQLARHHPGSPERLRQRSPVAGFPGYQLDRPVHRGHGCRRHPPASASSPVPSTRLTPRRCTATSFAGK